MAVIPLDVTKIIDTDRDVTPFLETASLLVDEILASSGLSVNRLDAIKKYLAAHFVWITETVGLVSKDIGATKEVYRTYSDKSVGLSSSRYGQTALALDTSGKLASVTANSGMKALFSVIPQHGNPPRYWVGWDWPTVI